MLFADYTKRILGLAKTVYLWLGYLTDLDPSRRKRIAKYANNIAQTIARATQALTRLQSSPDNRACRNEAIRELARINGYIETMVDVLDQQLDGRKLAGVKRRLERIEKKILPLGTPSAGKSGSIENIRLDRLAEAEGYFRALADGLRT